MSELDYLEPFIDLDEEGEVCVPTSEELEDDLDPCDACLGGCY
jgi:hypothetical protein